MKLLLGVFAADSISESTHSNYKYEYAVDLLKNRFGDRQVIITSHMEAPTKLQAVTIGTDVKAVIRMMHHTGQSHIRGLEGLKIYVKMYGCFLTPINMQKLREKIRIIISRGLSSLTRC